MNRYQWYYENVVARDLLAQFQYTNLHQIPRLKAIHLHVSTSQTLIDRKKILPFICGLQILCGQKLKRTYAKKSIAGFKLRSGQLLGAQATLRSSFMYFFLDKLSTIVFPKIRDYQGIHYSNFSGASYLLYPELENHYEIFEFIQGFHIIIQGSNRLLFFVLPKSTEN